MTKEATAIDEAAATLAADGATVIDRPAPESAAPTNSAGHERETFEDAVSRLAKLPRHEYDLVRRGEAKKGGWRQLTLDDAVDRKRDGGKSEHGENNGVKGQGSPVELPDPEEWPDEVDGSSLLDEITARLLDYVVMPDTKAQAIALWTLGTHAVKNFSIYPRLIVTSPTRECGKSTALDVIGHMAPRPLPASHTTVSPLFRLIDVHTPTILLDEADTFVSRDNKEMIGLINTGHRRGTHFLRNVGDNIEPRAFRVFAPMAIACIGRVPETVMGRSIVIHLKRRKRDEAIKNFSVGDHECIGPLDRICRQAWRWAGDNSEKISTRPEMPPTLYNRVRDNWAPLIAVADAAGRRWPVLARRIAETLASENTEGDDSDAITLLADIHDIFQARSIDRIGSTELAEALKNIEGRPWAEMSRTGKAITANALARQLAPFAVAPKNMKIEGRTVKGYDRQQFGDVFSSYLGHPPSATVHPLPTAQNRGLQTDQQPLPGFDGSGCHSPANPQKSATGSGSAVARGGIPPLERESAPADPFGPTLGEGCAEGQISTSDDAPDPEADL